MRSSCGNATQDDNYIKCLIGKIMNSKNVVGTLVLCSVFSLPTTWVNASSAVLVHKAFVNGTSCKVLNETVVQGDYKFTCLKVLNFNVWVSVALKTPPYFVTQDVLQTTSPFAPPSKIEFIVLWNGEDIHGVSYPTGTTVSVRLDGVDSNYQVTPKQPVTFFLPNVLHKFA